MVAKTSIELGIDAAACEWYGHTGSNHLWHPVGPLIGYNLQVTQQTDLTSPTPAAALVQDDDCLLGQEPFGFEFFHS